MNRTAAIEEDVLTDVGHPLMSRGRENQQNNSQEQQRQTDAN